MFQLELIVRVDPNLLAEEAMDSGIRDTFVNGWIDAVDEFQQNTPVGATGDLKRGWDIQDKSLASNVHQVTISNVADNALYRIAGRGPGRMPPHEPIYRWAVKKGIEDKTYVIRRAIARKGTRRWIEKKNWVGINNDGSFISNGRLLQIVEEIKIKLVD